MLAFSRNAWWRSPPWFVTVVLLARSVLAQGSAPQWSYPSVAWQQEQPTDPLDAPLLAGGMESYEPASPGAMDLDQLSDEELVHLYITTYQQTLRTVVADKASLVEPGRLLMQTGYTFSYGRQLDVSSTTHTFPELLFRYRLWNRLELRVAWAGVAWNRLQDLQTGTRDWDRSLSDPSIGARVLLNKQHGWLPATSATVSSPLNVDANLSVADRLDPFAGFGYSWALGGSWLLSGSSAAVWTREGDSRFLDFQQTVSMDWMANDRWGACVEWSSLFPEGARVTGMSHLLGPGVSYNFTRDCQVDVVTLFGLDEWSPDILTQVLLSWRL